LLVADTGNNRIRRVRLASSVVETVAGDLDNAAGFANAPGTAARFDAPRGLAVDASGAIYVADAGNHLIRRISGTGDVSTYAGSTAGYRDGAGPQACFANPHGLALDANGRLVVADADDAASPQGAYIRLVAPDQAVTTLAGTASVGWLDGERSPNYFAGAVELALDAAGNLYVADTRHNRIMVATPDGSVSVLAGSGERGAQDGPGAAASFGEPEGLIVDERNPAAARLLVSDTYNHKIRQIDLVDPTHPVTTLAGGGNPGNGEFDGGYANGAGLTARFKGPTGLAIDAATGTLIIGDHNNHRIRKMLLDDPSHEVSSFVGNGFIGHINGQGIFVSLAFPHAVALDAAGVLYVPDHDWNDIRRIQADGTVSDILEADDVQAMVDGANGKLGHPMGIALDRDGKLVIGDTWNHAIRLVDIANPAAPVVTTLAGTGMEGFLDGPAATARFRNPQGVRVDAQGNIYVADSGNSCIRKIVR
jgi:sugar lactone lactonase YvrE